MSDKILEAKKNLIIYSHQCSIFPYYLMDIKEAVEGCGVISYGGVKLELVKLLSFISTAGQKRKEAKLQCKDDSELEILDVKLDNELENFERAVQALDDDTFSF